ncbi:hypothetical protein D6D27_09955 [Aureobasidium pullulans]|uniref:Ubiquitin-like domain-containing protein n=1 Tax=Aureobasidium pullulans TaxID=5580 RepID=A0A4S8X5K7_AURPU|nr:hypothetical protein D6D27_09955 [Aureobasidium pullulans]THW32726.1 hypothetical protein D6D22_09474 [Aureobasidium pullulans]TIA65074.1 hypothetical protein D6C76_09487 [Aureobasidium pullulans]
MNAETIVPEGELCSAGVAFRDAAQNKTTDTVEHLEYPEDTSDLLEVSDGSELLCNKHQLTEMQERSEDNWIDIDVIGRQNQEDYIVAMMIEARNRATACKIEEAECNAAEKIKHLESMLKGACEERDDAKELCEKLKDAAFEERRLLADQLSIAKAEYESVRNEAQDLVHRLQAEMDAQRLRHAEAIANAKLEYHESLASANRYYEELQIMRGQDQEAHQQQLDTASSDWEARTKETQQHCELLKTEIDTERLRHTETIRRECEELRVSYAQEREELRVSHDLEKAAHKYHVETINSEWRALTRDAQQRCENLRAEMDEGRKKHVRVCEDTRLVHETYMDCTVRQHEQEKAVILEQLKYSSEIVETLEVKIQNQCQVIEELKEELIAQVNAATQRNADIESLTSELASVQRAHDDIFLLWKDQIRKTEVEAKRVRRLTSELDFAASDKIMLEKKVSSVEDEFERAHAYYLDPANVRLPDDEIEEELADKAQSLCEDCVRLKWENTEHIMIIDGLEADLMAARTETWETRQEHVVEIGRLINPSKHPLVVRVVAYTSDLRHGWREVALIKMNPDTSFQSVLKSLRKSHPRKVLQVEATGRFVFDSDTPTQLGLKGGETLLFFQERDEPKVMLDATMAVMSDWRGNNATI